MWRTYVPDRKTRKALQGPETAYQSNTGDGSGIISAGRTPTCAALLGARPWLVWCRRAPFPRQGRIIRHFPCLPPHAGGFVWRQPRCQNFPLVTPDRERVVSRPEDGAHAGAHDNDMPTPIPFADDGGIPPGAPATPRPPHHASRSGGSCSPLPRAPPLLAFMAAASWLAWMCFQGVMGPPGAIIALVGIAALAALIRRHTGMASRLWRCRLIAVVGLVAVVWVVFALLAVALVAW